MKYLILIFLLLFLFISCNRKECKTYPYDSKEAYGCFLDGLPIDTHIVYSEKKSILIRLCYNDIGTLVKRIYYYEEEGKIMLLDSLYNDKLVSQTSFYIDGDTAGYCIDYTSKYFGTPKFKPLIYNKSFEDGKTIYLQLDDSLNKVKDYKGPLDFLTKKDTMLLDSFYVDWREQCIEIERKRKEGLTQK